MNEIEKTKRFLASPLLRKVFPLGFVGAYIIALVLLLAGVYNIGLLIWVISTGGGALLLYAKKKQEQKLKDLEEEEAAYRRQEEQN